MSYVMVRRVFFLSAIFLVPNLAHAVDYILDDGTRENAIGDLGQFLWINRFTPDPGDYPFRLDQISVVFGTTNVTVGDPVELFVWSDTDGDGDPGTGAVLLGSVSETVQFADGATFSVYDLASPILLTGPGDMLIGVVNRAGFEGFNDFPAAIDQTASQGRSWAASYLAGDVPANPTLPGDEQWGTIDSFGFPGNWMVRAVGTPVALGGDARPVPTISGIGFGLLVSLLVGIGYRRIRSTV